MKFDRACAICREMHPGAVAMRRSTRLRRPPGRVQLRRELRQQRVPLPDGEVVHPTDVALQRSGRVHQRGGRETMRLCLGSVQVPHRRMRSRDSSLRRHRELSGSLGRVGLSGRQYHRREKPN